MKMKTLLALGLCFALTVPLLAQQKEMREVDSLCITPFADARIILVGKGLEKLLKENNLEVLKNKFVEDYKASAKDKDFPASAKNILYLAGADGRRRLKAVPDDTTPVNVKAEIQSFNSNLPPYHYAIYDLTKGYEYHLYLKDPEMLERLQQVNCNQLIAGTQKTKHQMGIKWARSAEIAFTDTGYFFKNIKGYHPDQLALQANMGIGLINSSLSPTLGADFYFERRNKYGKANYELGISYSFFLLTSYENKAFSSFYPISSYSVFYKKRFDLTGLGLSAGRFSTGSPFGSTQRSSLDKAWKVGLLADYGRFSLEYNFIFDRQKKTNTAFTLHYIF